MRAKDLESAYEKAAWNFQGQMRQQNLASRDKDVRGGPTGQPGSSGSQWSEKGRGGRGMTPSGRGGTKRPGDWKEPEGKMQRR